MSKLDRRYRDGIRAYVLSLDAGQKKEFEYKLMSMVQFHKRELRDMKELLFEEVQALAFLQEHLHVVPFRKPEESVLVVRDDVRGDNPQADSFNDIKHKAG